MARATPQFVLITDPTATAAHFLATPTLPPGSNRHPRGAPLDLQAGGGTRGDGGPCGRRPQKECARAPGIQRRAADVPGRAGGTFSYRRSPTYSPCLGSILAPFDSQPRGSKWPLDAYLPLIHNAAPNLFVCACRPVSWHIKRFAAGSASDWPTPPAHHHRHVRLGGPRPIPRCLRTLRRTPRRPKAHRARRRPSFFGRRGRGRHLARGDTAYRAGEG